MVCRLGRSMNAIMIKIIMMIKKDEDALRLVQI